MQSRPNKIALLKYIRSPYSREHGFTLIEVIIILMVLSIAALMAITFFENVFLNSTTPYVMTQEQFSSDTKAPGLSESMERVIADYNAAQNTTDRTTFKAGVSSSVNYDGSLSTSQFTITGITDTGTSLSFTKIVVSKNNQRIMAFFPIY